VGCPSKEGGGKKSMKGNNRKVAKPSIQAGKKKKLSDVLQGKEVERE